MKASEGIRRLGVTRGLVLGLFVILTLPLVFAPEIATHDQKDEALFHLATIKAFREQWPRLSFTDYPSATTPLYHLVLAPFAADIRVARLLSWSMSLGAVLAALGLVGRNLVGVLAVGCMAVSPYFVGPAVRLSTDNAALFLVFLALGSARWAGIWATGAVLVRQLHAWLVPVLMVRALWQRDSRQFLVALFPVVAIAPFVWLWSGLVPPGFQQGHQGGLNLDVLVVVLTLMGVVGLAFAQSIWHRHSPWALTAALGAVWLLWVHPVAYAPDPARWGGGVLQIVGKFPEVGGCDAVLWGLVPLGAFVWASGTLGAVVKRDWLWVVAPTAFIAANLFSQRAYQKYYDPFLVVCIAAWFQGNGKKAWLGPAILMGALVIIDLLRFWRPLLAQ